MKKTFGVLFGLLFTLVANQAQAMGNFYDFLRCDLKLGKDVLATTGEIALGPHSVPFSTTLYGNEANPVYAYVDVKPLGYEGSYNSSLSIVIGELPEDSGRGIERSTVVVDPFASEEGIDKYVAHLVINTLQDQTIVCYQRAEFEQD